MLIIVRKTQKNKLTTHAHNGVPRMKTMSVTLLRRVAPLFYSVVHALFESFLQCHHFQTPIREGKCYCPNCGEGLIYQWMVLRCNHCQARRPSRKILGQLVPQHRHCSQCGTQETTSITLSSPAYYQLDYAHLIRQNNVKPIVSLSSIVVWVNSWVDFSLLEHTDPSPIQALALLTDQE